jgi:hypothetical protein
MKRKWRIRWFFFTLSGRRPIGNLITESRKADRVSEAASGLEVHDRIQSYCMLFLVVRSSIRWVTTAPDIATLCGAKGTFSASRFG